MARPLSRIPTLADWRSGASRLGLRRQSGTLVGPCPACGGEDRFRVTSRGRFFCRQCCADRNAGADAMRRILEAAGLARELEAAGGSRPAGAPGSIANASLCRRMDEAEPPARPNHSMGRSGADTAPVRQRRSEGGAADLRGMDIPATPSNGAPERFTGSGIPLNRPETANPGTASRETARGASNGSEAANRIWGAAVRDAAPVKTYLAGRGAWPPDRDLPSSVRWLSRAAAERLNPALSERLRVRLPEDADGCAVYAYGPPGEGRLQAVQIEPLTADGSRAPWPARKPGGKPATRQSRGPMRGTAFPVKPPGADPAGPLRIAEGPVDALAIATWRGTQAWGAAGTSSLVALAPALAATGRPVVIEADGDRSGRKAAGDLLRALRGYGGSSLIEDLLLESGHESDPAECLAGDWAERAAVLKFGGGMGRTEAERAAWTELRPAGDWGDRPGA